MPSRRVVFALAVGVPVLILGTMFGLYVWGVASGYRSILAGPTADAVVLGTARCSSRAWQCSRRREVAVRLRFGTPDGAQTGYASAVDAPGVGTHVTVRYDPEKPERRVLILREWERERRLLVPFLAAGALIAVGLLAGGSVLFVRSRWQRRA